MFGLRGKQSSLVRSLLERERDIPAVPAAVRGRALARARAALAAGIGAEQLPAAHIRSAAPRRLRWAAAAVLVLLASAAAATAAYRIGIRTRSAELAPAPRPSLPSVRSAKVEAAPVANSEVTDPPAAPTMGAAAPTMGAAAPTMGAAAPTMGAAAPTMGAAAPTMGAAAPTMGAAAPTMGAAAPMGAAATMGAAAPTMGAAAPTMGAAAPTMGAAAPTMGAAAPMGAPSRGEAAREELRLLRQARAAVERADFAAALPPLTEHARRFKDGRLAEEREALRVKALAGLGRTDEARRVAAAFKARFPRSVLLPIVSQMPSSAP